MIKEKVCSWIEWFHIAISKLMLARANWIDDYVMLNMGAFINKRPFLHTNGIKIEYWRQ